MENDPSNEGHPAADAAAFVEDNEPNPDEMPSHTEESLPSSTPTTPKMDKPPKSIPERLKTFIDSVGNTSFFYSSNSGAVCSWRGTNHEAKEMGGRQYANCWLYLFLHTKEIGTTEI